MSYLKKRVQAFKYAFSGLKQAFKTEVHLNLFLGITLVVIGLAFFLQVSTADWMSLLLAITIVICLELFNSAIEKLCDVITTEKHPQIKYIKDVMAGAVLIACLYAAIIGVLVFKNYV